MLNTRLAVKERLLEYIKFKNLTVSKFESRSNLSNGYVKKLKGNIGAEKLEDILKAFPDLSRSWLLTGEGEMLTTADNPGTRHIADEISIPSPEELRQALRNGEWVPLLPVDAFAGAAATFYDRGIAPSECQRIFSPIKGTEWAIRVTGNSMEPRFHEGCILYIRRHTGSFVPWGNPMVIHTAGGTYLKFLYPSADPDCIQARSANPEYPPFDIPKDEIFGLYRILGTSYTYEVL